jgi:uncharacterized glyoxalase superfamily metalloenzyme YdcJ
VGHHKARFGEIEQRGAALTRKGRALYDALLAQALGGNRAVAYPDRLKQAFAAFPDDLPTLVEQGLIHARRRPQADGTTVLEPVQYEDFLPVSAAGIFQSNLSGEARQAYSEAASQAEFEAALGRAVIDPFDLYAAIETHSCRIPELACQA